MMQRIWKKIRYWIFWLGLLAYSLLVMSAVSAYERKIPCQVLRVIVKDSVELRFVERREVGKKLLNEQTGLLGASLSLINTHEIEKGVEMHPFVRKAEAYTTSEGVLRVEITQRKPVLRLIYPSQRSMYLDREGFLVPCADIKPAHTLVCNGHLPDPGTVRSATQIDSLKNASWYRQLYDMALFIAENEFWSAQFEQVYVRPDLEVELVPRVGAHMIMLGSLENYRGKLHKLMVLYREGLSRVGWNQYEWINLNYKDQVICTKK
ncbi:MAG: cell division protein FtsQ/DivIB [Bacteroidales bacterium]